MYIVQVFLADSNGKQQWNNWDYCDTLEQAYAAALNPAKAGDLFWRIKPSDEDWNFNFGFFFGHKWYKVDIGI